MERMTGYYGVTISKTLDEKLLKISEATGVPPQRLLAFQLEGIPLVKYEIPKVDWEEYAYADQAHKIITYLQKYGSDIDLDLLIILRHDIGLPNIDTLLKAFAECIHHKFIITKMKIPRFHPDKPPRQVYGLIKNTDTIKNKRYTQYLKLKQEFEGKKK